jgi:hypothetical protein
MLTWTCILEAIAHVTWSLWCKQSWCFTFYLDGSDGAMLLILLRGPCYGAILVFYLDGSDGAMQGKQAQNYL